MKMRERFKMPYGLRARFGFSFLVSGILCALIFLFLSSGAEYFLSYYFENSGFGKKQIERQADNLQAYINEHHISKENLFELSKWEKKQPLLLLELYEQSTCIYSSQEFENRESAYYDLEPDSATVQDNVVTISLYSGETVTAFLYSDFTYRYYVWGTVCSFIISLLIFVGIYILSIGKLIRYICRLENDIQILEGGNLEYEVTERGNNELTSLAKSMNRMRISFQEQMENEQKLHLSHQELVTQMAHDLRTPLTSIMLYTEILRAQKYENEEELQTYLEKIDLKAHHMKAMSDHLFRYNLESERQHEKDEILGFEKEFAERLKHMKEDLKNRGFQVDLVLDWESCYIQAKREYLDRILDNISSNLIKYAQREVPVRVETLDYGKYAGFVFTNVVAAESDEVESTSVGIQSIKTMMKQMEGVCSVEQTESVFEITILFLIS